MSENKNQLLDEKDQSGEVLKRVGGFPTVSLQDAIGLMQKVWDKEKRNPAPATAIAEHWGYATKSSGGFQALASLKRFGLLEEVAGTTPRSLKVSQMALDLMKYESTDPTAYRKQLKSLALLPDSHQAMWNKYGHELPSDKTIETHLVFDKHFSVDAAKKFIRLYKETISFAKMTEADTVEEELAHGQEIAPKQKPDERFGRIAANLISTPANKKVLAQYSIPIGANEATITFTGAELTTGDFDALADYVGIFKREFERKQKAESSYPIPPPKPPKPEFPEPPFVAQWKGQNFERMVKIIGQPWLEKGEWIYQADGGALVPAKELFPNLKK